MCDNKEIAQYEQTKNPLKIMQEETKALRERNICEARYEDGSYFTYDEKENVSIIASQGMMLETREHTSSLTFINEDGTIDGAINELNQKGVTQKVQGGFINKSQPTISQYHSATTNSNVQNTNDETVCEEDEIEIIFENDNNEE